MTLHLGNVDAGSTLYIPFHTFDSNGASITLTGLATSDLEIYKNGSVTQRSSDAGYTLLDTDGIDFDGLTGIHGFSIDLADNTDAGFYAAGSFYWVVVSSVTVDTRTVNFVAATFRIGPAAANVTQLLGTAWLAPGTAGTPDVNTKLAGGTAWGSGAITAASIAADAITAAKVADGTIDAATFAAGAITAAVIAANAIDADALAADVTTELQSGLATAAALDAVDNFLDTEIAAIITTLGTPAGVSISADIAVIEAQTDDIGAAGAGLTDLGGMSTTMKAQIEAEVDDSIGSGTGTALTAIPWNAAWDAEIQSEVDDALIAQRLDELLNADSDIDGAAPPTVGSVFHELMTKTAGSFTYDQTTDSNEALRDRGDAAWITATGFSTHSAADVWAAATRTLTAISDSAGVTTLLTRITAALEVYTAAHIRSAAGLGSANLDNQLGDIPTNAELATSQEAADDATLAAIAALNNLSIANIRTAVGLGSANLDTQLAAILAAWTTAMTEAYRGTNAAPTPVQALFEILAHLGESSISGTTKTLKKLDGSTTAKTYTLNSATTPTSITETT